MLNKYIYKKSMFQSSSGHKTNGRDKQYYMPNDIGIFQTASNPFKMTSLHSIVPVVIKPFE